MKKFYCVVYGLQIGLGQRALPTPVYVAFHDTLEAAKKYIETYILMPYSGYIIANGAIYTVTENCTKTPPVVPETKWESVST